MPKNVYSRPHEGKLAIVTGGSRGIGAAITRNLAAKGCNILLVYVADSSTEAAEVFCEGLTDLHGVGCVPVQADLAEPTQAVAHIVSTAKRNFSHPQTGVFQIDIIINNAGIAGNKLLNDPELGPIEETQFRNQYSVNVLAPLLLVQSCQPYLPKDRSGRIVNVSSVSASIGCESQSIYAGTKGALESMTRVWARELAEHCTVNAVNPGPVWGDMYSQAGERFWKLMQQHVNQAPLMRYAGGDQTIQGRAGGDPKEYDDLVLSSMGGQRPAFTDEIAGVVGMLCSVESGWTTGSVICANGGMKMSIA